MTQAGATKRRRSTTVHVKISGDILDKLDEMSGADRRDRPEFLRLLVEDEWTRRQTTAAGNGVKA